MYLCMDSIMQLEEPLLQLRQRDRDFEDCVPSEAEFSTMNELVKLLGAFHVSTQTLCAEITPTMHLVMVVIYNLEDLLAQTKINSKCDHVKAWADMALIEMDRRFPDCGGTTRAFALGNFFHPFYRGAVAASENAELLHGWLDELVEESRVVVRKLCFCNSDNRNGNVVFMHILTYFYVVLRSI